MAIKMDIKKLLTKTFIRAIPTTIIAVALLWGFGIVLTAIQSALGVVGTVFTTLVMALIAVVFYTYAKAMHKGKEDLASMIPTLILVSAVASVLALSFPQLALVLEISTVAGLALSLTVIYLAEEVSRKLVK